MILLNLDLISVHVCIATLGAVIMSLLYIQLVSVTALGQWRVPLVILLMVPALAKRV